MGSCFLSYCVPSLSLRVCSGSSLRGFLERENPILPPAWIVRCHCQILQLEGGKACFASLQSKHSLLVWETTEMLIGGWDGQWPCSAGCSVAAGRLEPRWRIAVLNLAFRCRRCDCRAVCIGMRKNAQRNVVFLPRGLKGKL